MTVAWTRREMLRILSLAGIGWSSGLLSGCTHPKADVKAVQDHRMYRNLLQPLQAPESAKRLGHAYLRAHPDEKDLQVLLAGLFYQLPPAEARRLAVFEPGQLERWLHSRHLQDFTEGRSCVVRKWVLSQTEARLFALAAML